MLLDLFVILFFMHENHTFAWLSPQMLLFSYQALWMALPLASTLPVRLCPYEVFSAMFASGHRCYILFYAVVSGMGLFFLGLLLQLIVLQWKFFHKMFFLIFTQKSTLLGGGFDVCQLVWRGRAIVSKKFSSSKRIWKFIRILWTFNFTSMRYSEVFFCCLCVFSRLIVIHRRLWLFAQGLWRLMWTLSCSRI